VIKIGEVLWDSTSQVSGSSIQEMRDALEATAGPQALDLLTYHRDPMIEAIVAGWPSHFESARASRLGFLSTESFEAVVQRFQTSK
jgi:hypothetical protein